MAELLRVAFYCLIQYLYCYDIFVRIYFVAKEKRGECVMLYINLYCCVVVQCSAV